MNKALSKAIIVRTKLRNTFFKNRSEEIKKSYNIQLNYCFTFAKKVREITNLNKKKTFVIIEKFGKY